jgi:hypothetical protein
MKTHGPLVVAVAFVATVGFGTVSGVSADDYHVAFSGSDLSGTGAATNPWRTITHTLNSIPAPTPTEIHTIHVGPGEWNPSTLELFPLMVPEGVILRGAGIDLTILSGVKSASRQPTPTYGAVLVKLLNPSAGPTPGIAPAEVTNLTMKHARNAIEVLGEATNVPEPYIHDVKFWKNTIGVQITNAAPQIEACLFDTNNMGVSVGRITTIGSDTWIARNRFVRNSNGINGANAVNLLIENNWFEQNGVGIMIGTVGLMVSSPHLRNNFYFNNGQGFTSTAVLGGLTVARVEHETFQGNITGIASLDDTVFGGRSNPDIRNCIIWGSLEFDVNGVSQEEIRNSDLSTAANVPIGPMIGVNGIMCQDPRFVDPDLGDLHLSDRSPCLDKGVNDFVGPETDADGEPRIVGYPDLGADEARTLLRHYRPGSRPGQLKLLLTARQDPWRTFVLAASLLGGKEYGIPIGDRVIPLYPDNVFYTSIGFSGRIPRFMGQLNGAGQALVKVFVPDWPWLRGRTLYLAYITLDASAPYGIKTISNVVTVDRGTL